MRPRSLYARLALVLLLLVGVIGFSFFSLVRFATQMYQQETAQRLNRELAAHIVAETPLLQARQINRQALKDLFHTLMVINPSIEVYLLDTQGTILAYSAPAQKVRRERVAVGPIRRFIAREGGYPLLGDDPRDPFGHKVFSAASIEHEQRREGYLYVILGGEQYDTAAAMLRANYSLRVSAWGIAAGLLIALLAGLALFALLTRRLRRLSATMQTFAADEPGGTGMDMRGAGDEIDQLERHFHAMAVRIRRQMDRLHHNDAQRRELIANVSHDLRTPLASLRAYLETLLIKNGVFDNAQRREYLHIALANSDQLAGLIESLFELAKLDAEEAPLQAEPFSAAELVHDVVLKHGLAAGQKGVKIGIECDEALPFVSGDIAMIERALNNLLENAIEHTPEGGRVVVRLAHDAGQVTLTVSDTGKGIPNEELAHIFDRFYRLQKSRQDGVKHAGLGLAIVKRIVELHGAVITAESALNEGTAFTFTLPEYAG